jgi:hypothetical protein
MLCKLLQSPGCTTHSLVTVLSILWQLQIQVPLFRHSRPHGSQDLNLCDYFVWGNERKNLYECRGWLCRQRQRNVGHVTQTPAGTTDIRVSRKTVALAAILCPLKKKGLKGRRSQEFWTHTYPTVSSRPRGSRVQSLVSIGSEMWICIRYKHIYIYTNKHSSLYIRCWNAGGIHL